MRKWKPILIGAILAIIAVTISTRWLPGRNMVDVTDQNMQSALQRWQNRSIDNYRVKVQVEGRLSDIYEVTVEDQEVVKVLLNGQLMKTERVKSTWTIPGMFRMLERDLENQARLENEGSGLFVRAQFDRESGVPNKYLRLDYSSRQQAGWKVLEFFVH